MCNVCVPWSRWGPVDECSSPRHFFGVETQQVVEHGLAVVAAKNVQGSLIVDHCVLRPVASVWFNFLASLPLNLFLILEVYF